LKFLKWFSLCLIIGLLLLTGNYLYAESVDNCNALYNYGQYQKAAACFYSMLSSNKKNVTYKLGYGNSLFAQKRYNEAKVQYSEIIQTNPSSKEAIIAKQKLAVTNNMLKTIKTSSQNDVGNYISSVSTAKWTSMPVMVWVEPSVYSSSVIKAFNEWQDKTKGVVSFTFVQNPSDAKIIVRFKSNIQVSQGDALGNTNIAIRNGTIVYAYIDLKTTTKAGVKQSNSEVYANALHEVGHALGIRGHSNNKFDVMYPDDNNYRNVLSNRDINTVLAIYR